MRTRWLVVLLGLSFAANLTLATALWQGQRGHLPAPALAADESLACPLEERAAREELATLLCRRPADRPAIEAALARLDDVRRQQRQTALERWISSCERTSAPEREELHRGIRHRLCPWSNAGEGCCAPSSGPGGAPTDNARPRHHGGSQS